MAEPDKIKDLIQFARSRRQIEILTKIIEHGGNVRSASDELGIHYVNAHRAVQRCEFNARKRGYSPEHKLEHSVPEGYLMERYTLQVNGNGETERIWVKGKQDQERFEENVRAWVEGLELDIPRFAPVNSPEFLFDELCTNLIIGDAHLGLLAWEPETGVENYDADTCVKDLVAASNYLISTSPPTELCRIINVGDLMHCNDPRFVTPAHNNPLDHDGRFPKVMKRAARMVRSVVEMALGKFSRVEIVNARGNHDPDAALWINLVLETAYENEPRVKVVPNERHLIPLQFGKVFTPVCHGDKAPFQRRYNSLTHTFSKEFGDCNHVYCWQGHLHHKQREEIGSCVFEVFNSMTAPDVWHADSGYGAERNMTAIILHKEYGEVDRKVCSLNLARHFQDSIS